MTDIIERLRYPVLDEVTSRDLKVIYRRMREAADEIERLRKETRSAPAQCADLLQENKQLREAIDAIYSAWFALQPEELDDTIAAARNLTTHAR